MEEEMNEETIHDPESLAWKFFSGKQPNQYLISVAAQTRKASKKSQNMVCAA